MTQTDHRSDTELLTAYERDGDEAAFEALAARHVDMIFAVSLRRSGNRQLAEEASIESSHYELWIQTNKSERIKSELNALQQILDEKQLSRYREHLEAEPAW